jgi:hypothetical protein
VLLLYDERRQVFERGQPHAHRNKGTFHPLPRAQATTRVSLITTRAGRLRRSSFGGSSCQPGRDIPHHTTTPPHTHTRHQHLLSACTPCGASQPSKKGWQPKPQAHDTPTTMRHIANSQSKQVLRRGAQTRHTVQQQQQSAAGMPCGWPASHERAARHSHCNKPGAQARMRWVVTRSTLP